MGYYVVIPRKITVRMMAEDCNIKPGVGNSHQHVMIDCQV